MIIGSGSIASMLNDRKGFVFFAAGVSNSSETDENEYRREVKLMYKTLYETNMSDPPNLVYFSSISIFTVTSRYTKHKKEMEDFVKSHFPNRTIIRIGNVWECRNPNTFINKMLHWQRQGKLLDSMIRDEYKYMISKEQLNFVTDNLPRTGKHEISIFGEALKVSECLKR